jgi:hypothetical protein
MSDSGDHQIESPRHPTATGQKTPLASSEYQSQHSRCLVLPPLFPQDGIAGETTRNASAKNKVQSTKNKLPFPNSTQRQMALDRFKDAQRRRRKPVKIPGFHAKNSKNSKAPNSAWSGPKSNHLRRHMTNDSQTPKSNHCQTPGIRGSDAAANRKRPKLPSLSIRS